MNRQWLFLTLFCFAISCTPSGEKKLSTPEFLKKANEELKHETKAASIASWVHANFITEDTTYISSEYNARYSAKATELALDSKNYRGQTDSEKRMLKLMLNVLTVPAPKDSKKNKELAKLRSELESMYGSGEYCKEEGKCQSLEDLEKVIKNSRNPEELLEAWEGWRTVSVPMKEKFQQTVAIGNQGAQELGYAHMSDLWRSNYDMKPEEFEKELDRLWLEVKPFYDQLHCYMRAQLNKKYGDEVVDPSGPIPAHLLGNMWAQAWDNLIDLVDIKDGQSTDIGELLKKAQYDSKKMVKTAENFFVSLGMPDLPQTFYEKSLFEKPQDREVVCHASAWHMDSEDDVRIKMCIEIDEDQFRTIHHELGHIYYYLAYKDLPQIYQASANDGFHEALGDTIELSITNKYLQQIDLLKESTNDSNNANKILMRMALGKVAFLPFGLMIDKWRWQVFDGRTKPENYNQDWWKLREKYQGVKAPATRPNDAFDPGAKYHIPAYTPYSRYFIAHILQFQFHRALCKAAGHQGPLHECSIYGSRKAGEQLWKMMKMGASKPWPEALKAATGSETMDATALRDYFQPLEAWLKQANANNKCGW